MLGLLGAGLATIILFQMGQGDASWTPAIGYSTAGYLLTMAVYDLSRSFWVAGWQRICPLDHGLKMTGFYFALLSAAAGNLLEGWQPLSQLIPSGLGVVTMIVFVVWYAFHPIGGGIRTQA